MSLSFSLPLFSLSPSFSLIALHFLCPLPLQATCNTLSDPTGWEYTRFVTYRHTPTPHTHWYREWDGQWHTSSPDTKCHLSTKTGGDGEWGQVNNKTESTHTQPAWWYTVWEKCQPWQWSVFMDLTVTDDLKLQNVSLISVLITSSSIDGN